MSCESIFVELKEKGLDRESIDNIALYTRRLREGESRARNTGRYAKDSEKEDFSIDSIIAKKHTDRFKGMIGKTITVLNTSNNTANSVKIKEIFGVSRDIVNINGVRYDIHTGVSLDGSTEVDVFGSEQNHNTEGYTLRESMSIKTADDLYDVFDKLAAEDTQLDNVHFERLVNVVDTYAEIMRNAVNEMDITVDVMEDLLIRDDQYTRGTANPTLGKMRLLMASKKWASGLEIFAHETQHVLIEEAIKKDKNITFEINKLRKAMQRETTYEMFLDGIENPTSEDIKRAKSLYDYAFNNTDSPASEFLAYATTNKAMIEAIGEITYNDTLFGYFSEETARNNRLAKIANRIFQMINNIYQSLRYGRGASGHTVAMNLMKKALEARAQQGKAEEAGMFSNISEWLNKNDKLVSSYNSKITGEITDLKEIFKEKVEARESIPAKLIRKITNIRQLAAARSFVLQNGVFSSITRGNQTGDVAKFYDLYRQSKLLVDKTVYTIKNVTFDELQKQYGFKDMDSGLKRAVKKGLLDTDYRSVGSLDDVVRVLSDEKELQIELEKAKAGLKPETVEAAKALGVLIYTNESEVDNVYTNATQIATMVEKLTAEPVVQKIDKLASLYAMRLIDNVDKELTLKAIAENRRGVEAAMNIYYAHENELLAKAYEGNKWLLDKGTKQESYKDNKKYYLVDEAEMKELTTKTKMVNIGEQTEISRFVGKPVYMVVGDSIDTAYTEGLLSTIQLKSEGESIRRIMAKFGMTNEEAEDKMNIVLSGTGSKLVPDRRYDGSIMDYRFRIPQETKEQYMGLDNDLAETVSHTVSNATHKDQAIAMNRVAVEHLVKFYEKYKNDPSMNFIKIDADTTGKYKEYWDILPAYLKKDLKRLTGKDALYVEESMLIDFFGYKDASISNLVKSKKWKMYTLKLEAMAKELVQRWKKVIVTMTGSTIYGNLTSNMYVTLQHTNNKNPAVYLKDFYKVWEQMNEYQNTARDVQKLRVRQAAGEDISNAEIAALEKTMEENPVHDVMADGQYSVLLEDIDLGLYENKGILAGKIHDILGAIGKKKGNDTVKKVFDELYLTNDSKIYSKLVKLTQYGDVINRIMIHNDNLKNDKMSKVDSLRYVDGLFVNYSYLDNKYIKYMNDLGFVTFTKYFFRTLPAMLRMFALKPVTMFAAETTRGLTGGVVESPTDQIYNPFETLFRKLLIWDEPMNMMQTLFTPNIVKPIP